MTQRYQLAQVNIGRARAAMEDPVMADFAARLVYEAQRFS